MEALRQSQDGSSNPARTNCQGLRFDDLNHVKPRQASEPQLAGIDVGEVMKLKFQKRTVDPNSQLGDTSGSTSVHLLTNPVKEIPIETPLTRVQG
jgi:hypothetical protein